MIFATLRILHILFFRTLGRVFFYLFKKRRRIAIANIKRCRSFLLAKAGCDKKGLLCDPEVFARKLTRKSFISLGHNFGDFLLLKHYTKKNIKNYVKIKGFSNFDEARASGTGVILSTGHFGSWELAAHALALYGFPGMIIYNKFKKPEWLDNAVKRQREHGGNTLILKDNSFLQLYKHLKKNGIIVLVTDQHAAPPHGQQVPFLGHDKAWSHTAFVKMSIKAQAPIVPVYMFTDGISRYTIEFFKPIYPQNFANDENHVYGMARACNEAHEAAILRAPDLWMWQHRRFKV